MATTLNENQRRHYRSGSSGRRGVSATGAGGLEVIGLDRIVAQHKRHGARRIKAQLVVSGLRVHKRPKSRASRHGQTVTNGQSGEPPDDERRRWNFRSLHGAKLAAQSVGFQSPQRDDPALWRVTNPEGITIEDWPLTYEELEPYYDRIEYEIGVSGKAGNIGGKIDDRGNIFEGVRKREYPMPALRTSGYMEKMAAAGKSLGWHPFLAPAAITSKAYEGRPGCAYHGYCIGAGCHINAKVRPP